MDMIEADLP